MSNQKVAEQLNFNQNVLMANVNDVPVPSTQLLESIEQMLKKAHGKNVFYVARNLLRFIIDGEARELLKEMYAYEYFRLFTLVVSASEPSSKPLSGLDTLDQFGSFNVVLVMFELALFNQDVIKRAKSGPVMSHRQAIFQYLNQFINVTEPGSSSEESKVTHRESLAEYKLKCQLANIHKSEDIAGQKKKLTDFKVRLLYAMMFYSFEIQNDMLLSVNIYQMLQSETNISLLAPIAQQWIAEGYNLDQ